jgi:predicted ATPase/DNA-binding SARP family transcriptional activator
MFGTLRATRVDASVTKFRTRRVASLLAYLATFKSQAHSKDLLADLLWPDLDFDVSRRNLRQAVYELRKVLEPGPDLAGRVVLSIHDGFQLNPELVVTDVEEFEDWIAKSQSGASTECLQNAARLYKGSLLPGFADSWITLEQIRLEDLYLFALAELGDKQEATAAIGPLRTGLKLDPGNPKWHVSLIERYLEVGQPNRAKTQLTELETALEGERPAVVADLSVRIGAALVPKASTHSTSKAAPPKPRTLLPAIANRFFGRKEEVQDVFRRLESGSSRLITLQGPAGVGKTRLSIECGRQIAGKLDWNVIFVPLADRSKGEELYEAILSAIQPSQPVSDPSLAQIINLTKFRPTLLILDNLEQIADQVSIRVANLLAESLDLRVLGTSRQPLQIVEEQIITVEPLPLPTENWRGTEQLEKVPSVQLFLDRCQALRPEIRLDRRSAKVIADLCFRFDGLPLAIEIAAGLSGSFSLSQMIRHLPDRQTEILNRRRDSPARHKSLKAAIDWGFLSLAPELCQLFLRLSVFRGSFGLSAAKAICLEDGESIVNAINALVDCSLVRRIANEEDLAPRFSLLVAFREYAENRIPSSEMTTLRERHANYFASRTPPSRPYRGVDEQTAVHMEIEGDYENFLAAAEYSISVDNFSRATDLLAILSARWLTQGPKVAERELIRRLATHPMRVSLEPSKRVLLLRMLGTTFIRSGEYQSAYDSCASAVQISEAAGDMELLATCYSGLSVCAEYLGHLEECETLNRKVLDIVGDNNLVLAERSHLGIGSVLSNLGKFEEARAEFDLARRLSERLRGGEPDALIVVNQAETLLALGRADSAIKYAHEAIRISKRLRDEFTLALALSVLAKSQLERGAFDRAAATNLEALARFRRGNFAFFILKGFRNHAVILAQLKRFSEAAMLMSMTSEIAHGPEGSHYLSEQKAMGAIRLGMSRDSFEASWAKGLGMGVDEVFDFLFPDIAA